MARRRTGRPVPRTEDVYSLALRLQRRELVGGLLHAMWESSHAPGMSFRTALPSASTARRRSGGVQTSLARTSATLWCMVAWCGSR